MSLPSFIQKTEPTFNYHDRKNEMEKKSVQSIEKNSSSQNGILSLQNPLKLCTADGEASAWNKSMEALPNRSGHRCP